MVEGNAKVLQSRNDSRTRERGRERVCAIVFLPLFFAMVECSILREYREFPSLFTHLPNVPRN